MGARRLGAYVPDQSAYGPTWQRVLFIDLAAGAGAIAGGVFGCVANVSGCLKAPSPKADARSIQAWSALAGAGVGVVGGWLGTRNFDQEEADGRTKAPPKAMPIATVAPMRDAGGNTVPAFAAMGSF